MSATFTLDDIRERAREVRRKILRSMIEGPTRLLNNLTPMTGQGFIEAGNGVYDAPVVEDILFPPFKFFIRDYDTEYQIADLPVRVDALPGIRWGSDEQAEAWAYELSRLVNLYGLTIGVRAGDATAAVRLEFLYNLTINYIVFEDEVVGFIHPAEYPPQYREESDEAGNVYYILDVPAVGQAFQAQLGGVTIFVLAYAKICYRTENDQFVCGPGFILHVHNCSSTDLEIMIYGKRIAAPAMKYTKYIDAAQFSIHALSNVPEEAACELVLPTPPSDAENEEVPDETPETRVVSDNPWDCVAVSIDSIEKTATFTNNCDETVYVEIYDCAGVNCDGTTGDPGGFLRESFTLAPGEERTIDIAGCVEQCETPEACCCAHARKATSDTWYNKAIICTA